jgi:hypothetical protein
MTLLLVVVVKVALIAFIVGGVATLITRAVGRSRANRLDPRWKPHHGQLGYEASAHGAMPNTPLPEWALLGGHRDDEHHDDRVR